MPLYDDDDGDGWLRMTYELSWLHFDGTEASVKSQLGQIIAENSSDIDIGGIEDCVADSDGQCSKCGRLWNKGKYFKQISVPAFVWCAPCGTNFDPPKAHKALETQGISEQCRRCKQSLKPHQERFVIKFEPIHFCVMCITRLWKATPTW